MSAWVCSILYGSIFHNLLLFGAFTQWLNLTAILVPYFLSLTVKYIFDTATTSAVLNRLLNAVILISILDVIVALVFGIGLAIQLLPVVFLVSFVTISYLCVKYYRARHPLINTFIFAYAAYIVGMSMTLFCTLGVISFNYYYFHAS